MPLNPASALVDIPSLMNAATNDYAATNAAMDTKRRTALLQNEDARTQTKFDEWKKTAESRIDATRSKNKADAQDDKNRERAGKALGSDDYIETDTAASKQAQKDQDKLISKQTKGATAFEYMKHIDSPESYQAAMEDYMVTEDVTQSVAEKVFGGKEYSPRTAGRVQAYARNAQSVNAMQQENLKQDAATGRTELTTTAQMEMHLATIKAANDRSDAELRLAQIEGSQISYEQATQHLPNDETLAQAFQGAIDPEEIEDPIQGREAMTLFKSYLNDERIRYNQQQEVYVLQQQQGIPNPTPPAPMMTNEQLMARATGIVRRKYGEGETALLPTKDAVEVVVDRWMSTGSMQRFMEQRGISDNEARQIIEMSYGLAPEAFLSLPPDDLETQRY